MMFALRHINPFHSVRLERQIDAMNAQVAAIKRGVMNYIDVGGRQLPTTSAQGILRRAIMAENDLATARLTIAAALRDLESGRHNIARAELEACCRHGHTHYVPCWRCGVFHPFQFLSHLVG